MVKAAKQPEAKLAFVGDLMLGRLVSQHLRRRDPEWAWGDLIGLMQDADAVFGNLECSVTRFNGVWRRSPKTFHFRADPAMIDVLRAGNVRFVSLANNHALDCEEQGLFETIGLLDQAGIAHAGAGADGNAAAAPTFVRAGPLNVAALAVTDNMPEAGATETEAGVNYVAPDTEESGPSGADIQRARAGGADLVVVSAHLGPNMVIEPAPALRSYKRRLAARGADIVHGHSAHVIQGLERVTSALIMHDTGDFVDDYAVEPSLRNDLSFLFLVDAAKTGVKGVTLVPVRLYMAQVRLAPPTDADWICTRMQALSRAFGVTLERTPQGLRVEFPGNGGGPGALSKASEAAT
jgi:poly-gamma-glutamate synthesis protein (capsule biosynthesis protein)